MTTIGDGIRVELQFLKVRRQNGFATFHETSFSQSVDARGTLPAIPPQFAAATSSRGDCLPGDAKPSISMAMDGPETPESIAQQSSLFNGFTIPAQLRFGKFAKSMPAETLTETPPNAIHVKRWHLDQYPTVTITGWNCHVNGAHQSLTRTLALLG